MSILSHAELARYSRHIILPDIGLEGQQKLKAAKVLVVGAGGLGSPLLLYLAAAGVGHIGIVEFDTVDYSNLQRQVLFGTSDAGKSKAEAAKRRILELNPHIHVETHEVSLNASNAADILRHYDIVADGTDNFPTRYLVNDACVLLGKVNVYASIYRFDGQVSVFNLPFADGSRGPNYRDLFPEPPPPGSVPSCAEGGVLGVLPGIIGSLQALEVIKVITCAGEPLAGRLFVLDALNFETRILKLPKDPANPLTGSHPTQKELIDYDAFCGIRPPDSGEGSLPEISVQELQRWRAEGRDFQLVDVREPYEYEIADLGGEHIPLGQLADNREMISRTRPVVLYCRSGKRSAKGLEALREKGFTNLYNLSGGILAWADQIDPEMAKY